MITTIRDNLNISVEEMKSFLRITNLTSTDEAYLKLCIDTAKQEADNYCQNDFITTTQEDPDTFSVFIPGAVKSAVMQIASTLFTERNDHAVSSNVSGFSYSHGIPTWNAFRLLHPYRCYCV